MASIVSGGSIHTKYNWGDLSPKTRSAAKREVKKVQGKAKVNTQETCDRGVSPSPKKRSWKDLELKGRSLCVEAFFFMVLL